ncbi:DNA (cytosine-5-)-methyltransferase [Listeria seeligeri]|uniref:DNA (cytosine-5-)-methyltransferase n=1 Tax=Listeria seeligeri TaxID=1640 RepID=UPI0030D27611
MLNKDKIIAAMHQKDISTQIELANKLGMSKSQLSMLLSENYSPIKSNVISLCTELNIKLNDVLEVSNFETSSSGYEQLELALDNGISTLDKNNFRNSNFTDIQNVKPSKSFKVLELFAGAGGLALGLEKAGLESIGAIELDKHACNTLRKNREGWNVIEGDIVAIANEGITNFVDIGVGELDLLSGGYPCQAFSYAGMKRGLEDVRGTLFYSYAQVLKDLMPKMFLAENVKGLVNHDNGNTLSTMIKVFSDIGYTVTWDILKAVDYDVAQKRERIVIIGVRNDIANLQNENFAYPLPYSNKLTLKDVLTDVPESAGTSYPASKKKVLDLVPPGGYWRDLPENIAKEYMGKSFYSGGGRTGMARRLAWDEPSLTLTCSPAQKQTERCHPDETRPFTIREYARIQSFPDDWVFDCSITNAYKQIGNAVPVNLGTAIGKSIVNYLNKI